MIGKARNRRTVADLIRTRAAEKSRRRWAKLTPEQRAAEWAEVRERQKEARPDYQRWLFRGCR